VCNCTPMDDISSSGKNYIASYLGLTQSNSLDLTSPCSNAIDYRSQDV
jgi:hypothetical protein